MQSHSETRQREKKDSKSSFPNSYMYIHMQIDIRVGPSILHSRSRRHRALPFLHLPLLLASAHV